MDDLQKLFSEAQKNTSRVEKEKKKQYLPEGFLKQKKEPPSTKPVSELPEDPSSLFQKANPHAPKGRRTAVFNPVVKDSDNPELVLLVSFYPSQKMIHALEAELGRVYNRYVEFKILYAFDYLISKKDLEKNIEDFCLDHALDFTKYIPKGAKILAYGKTLYALTLNTALQLDAFYDSTFNHTSFYYPPTGSYVFPVPDIQFLFEGQPRPANMKPRWDIFFYRNQIKRLKELDGTPIRLPQLNRVLVEDPNEFLRSHIGIKEKVSWDLETTGFNFQTDEIICITLSFDGQTGYYLDWDKIDKKILNEFMVGKYLIGANSKFDWKFLLYRGIQPVHVEWDTMSAGHCLNEMRSNSLETHGWIYTYYGGHEIPLKRYKHKHPKAIKTYRDIPEDLMLQYAVDDAIITYQVHEAQEAQMKLDPKLYDYYHEHILPNIPMYAEIELRGVDIDWEKLREVTLQIEEEKTELEKEILKECGGKEFNLTSNKELGLFLEFEMGLPDLEMRAKGDPPRGGYYLTGKVPLREWKKRGYKIADLILKYRAICTLQNSFLGDEEGASAYWKFRTAEDKVHPTYFANQTKSHRNSCKNPNLQQAPKHGKKAKVYRSIFTTPGREYGLSEGDYAGFQMRIAGVLSGDQNLIDAFMKFGGDPHSVTAVKIYHPNWEIEQFLKVKNEEPYNSERSVGKTSNFAFLFGGQAYSFCQDTIKQEWSSSQCKSFLRSKGIRVAPRDDEFLKVAEFIRDSYFRGYPRLEEWHKRCHKEALKRFYIRCVHGARRLLPQLESLDLSHPPDKKLQRDLLNIAVNSRVQNFEVVAISRGMRKIHEYLKVHDKKSYIMGMIHDAVVFYIHKDEREEMQKIITEVMEADYPEYKGMHMVYELDWADPRDPDNPTYWGH